MKYIRPPDFKSVREFEAHYKKIEQDITELLTTDGSASTANELNAKLSQALSAATSYLANVNRNFTNNELPTAFQEGRSNIKEPPKVSAKEAAAILEKQGFKYAKNGFSRDTYIELQTATQTALKGVQIRVNSIIKDLHKTGQDSVYNVQQAIIKDLEQHAIFSVTYSNGAKQSLHSYAAMAARSARIESTNIGAIGRALQAGTDLVKMTTMPQCCKLCGAYQGKVYSISGKDKRFPALFKTVLQSGYALPHPNCRHEFIPWFEEIEAPEDVEKAIRNSKIQYDKNGELVDVRYQRDIKGYAEWQAGNRQLNRELLEFQQMKDHYAGRETEMPYKTLGAFRREARKPIEKQSRIMRQWRNRDRDIEEYKKIKSTLGANKVPETFDKFKDMKYNNIEQFSLIRREERMRRESVSQPKIPNATQANMPKEKTFGYVLNPEHDVGKHKARVIKSALGYTQEDYSEFTEQVIENLAYYKATEKEPTEHGRKFLVRMILTGKTCKRLLVETVWQIDNGSDVPRFITITFPK